MRSKKITIYKLLRKSDGTVTYSRPLLRKWGGKVKESMQKVYVILEINEFPLGPVKNEKLIDEELARAFTKHERVRMPNEDCLPF